MTHRRPHRLLGTALVSAVLGVAALGGAGPVGASDGSLPGEDEQLPLPAEEEALSDEELAAIKALGDGQTDAHGTFIMKFKSAARCRAAIRVVRDTYGWVAHCHGSSLYIAF